MKLRHKLTLGVAILTAAVIFICCFLIISQYRRMMLEESIKSVEEESISLAASLSNSQISFKETDDIPLSVKNTMLRYIIEKEEKDAQPGSSYALYYKDEPICNNSGIDPTLCGDDFSYTDDQFCRCCLTSSYCITEFEPFHNRPTDTNALDHVIYVIRDISSVTEKINRFVIFCVICGGCAVALCVVGIALYLRRSLRALEALNNATSEIADGNYEKRVLVGDARKNSRDELYILSDSFNKMADAVEEHIRDVEDSAERQKMMLSSLAHEMRTPVTAISGYAYALGNAELNESQRSEAVRFIDEESRRLSRLSDKLRLLVGVEHTEAEFEMIGADEWKAELQRILSTVGKSEYHIDLGGGTIPGDRDLLTVFITNLCTNAERAGADRVTVSFADGILSVSDNGTGIDPALLPKITEPFFVGDRSRNRSGRPTGDGFGLGLSICAKIAGLHRTKLSFGRSASGGTSVSVDLNALFTTLLQPNDDIQTGDDVK